MARVLSSLSHGPCDIALYSDIFVWLIGGRMASESINRNYRGLPCMCYSRRKPHRGLDTRDVYLVCEGFIASLAATGTGEVNRFQIVYINPSARGILKTVSIQFFLSQNFPYFCQTISHLPKCSLPAFSSPSWPAWSWLELSRAISSLAAAPMIMKFAVYVSDA